jgi:hypothetical protein
MRDRGIVETSREGCEVSIFAGIVRKLETSGNEDGNENLFWMKKCGFIGKSGQLRKRRMSPFKETSMRFWGV